MKEKLQEYFLIVQKLKRSSCKEDDKRHCRQQAKTNIIILFECGTEYMGHLSTASGHCSDQYWWRNSKIIIKIFQS